MQFCLTGELQMGQPLLLLFYFKHMPDGPAADVLHVQPWCPWQLHSALNNTDTGKDLHDHDRVNFS